MVLQISSHQEIYDQVEKGVSNSAATLVTGTTIFTIAGGPIAVRFMQAVCVTGNDATASTLQWSHDPTNGAAATFSGASASLANAAAGASVTLVPNALTTAPALAANGPIIPTGGGGYGDVILQPGIITTTIAVGSTTGTWRHFMRYVPMARGVTVT